MAQSKTIDYFKLDNLKAFINSNKDLDEYLNELDEMETLEDLLSEVDIGLKKIKENLIDSYSLSESYFHRFMEKIIFSEQEKRIINLNYGEKILRFIQKFIQYALVVATAFAILVSLIPFSLYVFIGISAVFGIILSALYVYFLNKNNDKIIYVPLWDWDNTLAFRRTL